MLILLSISIDSSCPSGILTLVIGMRLSWDFSTIYLQVTHDADFNTANRKVKVLLMHDKYSSYWQQVASANLIEHQTYDLDIKVPMPQDAVASLQYSFFAIQSVKAAIWVERHAGLSNMHDKLWLKRSLQLSYTISLCLYLFLYIPF